MGHANISAPVDGTKGSDGVSQPKKKGGEIAVIRIGSNVEYAPFLEFGTERNRPQPFLLPAYLNTIGKITKLIENIE